MPIYLGTQQVNGIWLGADEVVNVWKGTDLIYTKGTPPGPSAGTLFDHGWITDIPWSGNLLTRPQYTSQATYSFSNVDTLGYMTLTINCEAAFSSVNHNCHVCTTNLITVPSDATYMKVTIRQNESNVYGNWGLVAANASNCIDATGGQLTGYTLLSASDSSQTLTQTLASAVKGQTLRAIFNMRKNVKAIAGADGPVSIDIFKFWFE